MLLKYSIDYYLELIQQKHYFAQVGYSDAEWYCMLGHRVGTATGLGQIIDKKHGNRLLNVLIKRKTDPNFKVSIPKCLLELPLFHNNQKFEEFLEEVELQYLTWYERDGITDTLAENAELYPLINQLQTMSVVVIGNKHLRRLDFLNYKHFVEISCPNLHLEPNGIETAVEKSLEYQQEGTIYLVSAGVSAAIIIDQLYDRVVPNSFFFDCGSIWDAFVGIGGQRQWRTTLYSSPEKLAEWKRRNLTGK